MNTQELIKKVRALKSNVGGGDFQGGYNVALVRVLDELLDDPDEEEAAELAAGQVGFCPDPAGD